MNQKEIAELFVAEAMRQSKKRGMATYEKSANRVIAEIMGAALAEVIIEHSQRPDEAPPEKAKKR